MSEYKIGQIFRIKDNSYEISLRGKTGVLVDIQGNNLGLDFNEVIGNLTWNLEGKCSQRTGRLMAKNQCILIPGDWDA